ncbi:MAG: hypothetical protein GYB36_13425 [Alphaproteobacteria bacterium]|nr:hypothetical protein [Alphaproteobacteria bacterium]
MNGIGASTGFAYQPVASVWGGNEPVRPRPVENPQTVQPVQETPEDDPYTLSDEEQKVVNELSARDREVRAHEQAHKAVGGAYTGAISYTYQQGPDGKNYAVGGEVPIDASEIPGDPEATIEKMRIVKAAALAPAEPSGQDRKVAAQADAKAAAARAELNAQQTQANDPNAPKDPLDMDMNQRLAEMRREEEEAGSHVATSDLMAYASSAYGAQAA